MQLTEHFQQQLSISNWLLKKTCKAIRSDPQPLRRIIFTGDLNFPSVHWISQTVNLCATETREQADELLEFFKDFFMEQLVHVTRERNILYIFANNDHESVSFVLLEEIDRKTSQHKTKITLANKKKDFFQNALDIYTYSGAE